MADDKIDFDVYHPNPLFVIISGPSGVGKDAAIQELRRRDLKLHVIVTATDREARANEVNGVDYFFVSKERFEEMIRNCELIEHSLVYNDHKGIPRNQVEDAFASGKDVVIRVDVQGAEKLRKIFPEAVTIFLVPHNYEEWCLRLRNRKSETEESFLKRVAEAEVEMTHLKKFDYVVVNAHEQLEEAVNIIIAIMDAEHHRVNPRKVSL